MDKKYQLKTLFNGIELPLDDLEQLRLTPSLSQSMTNVNNLTGYKKIINLKKLMIF